MIPTVTVELRAGGVWTDVSSYASLTAGMQIRRGRDQRFDTVQPGTLRLTFKNHDGRFTPGKATLVGGAPNPLFPFIRPGTAIRVTVSTGSPLLLSPTLLPSPSLMLGGSTVAARRFVGTVDRWPVAWQGGMLSYVTITATDAFKQFARRTMKAAWLEETLSNRPTMLYTLGEPSGDTISDLLAIGPAAQFQLSGSPVGEATLGAASLFTSGETSLFLGVGAGSLGFSGATARFESPLIESVPFTIGFWVNCQSLDGPIYHQTHTAGGGSPHIHGGAFHSLSISEGSVPGSVQIYVASVGTDWASAESTVDITDRKDHRVHVGLRSDSSPFVLVDGVDVSNVTGTASILMLGGERTELGGDRDARTYFNGNLAAFTVYDHAVTTAQAMNEYVGGDTGFKGERTDQRIRRIARWSGITNLRLDIGASTVGAQDDLAGQTALAAMQAVEQSEQGALFIAGDGYLEFHSRYHALGMTPAITVDAADIDPDFTVGVDEDWLVNEEIVSGVHVGPVRRFKQGSIDEYGVVSETESTLLATVADLEGYGDYRLNRRAYAQPRSESLGLDPLTEDSLSTAVVTSEIGQLLAINDLPVEAAALATQTIESLTETIDKNTWRLSVTTTDADLTNYMVWDSFDWDDGSVWAW